MSPSWAIPEERESGMHSITGEPLVWAASGGRILALFFVLNLSWAAFILDRNANLERPVGMIQYGDTLQAIVDFVLGSQ